MDAQRIDNEPDIRWAPMSCRVPVGLPRERARRWCLLVTLRDYQASRRRGRPIIRMNLRRLLERRVGIADPLLAVEPALIAATAHELRVLLRAW